MTRISKQVSICLVLLALSAVARSADVKTSGVIFGQFGQYLSDRSSGGVFVQGRDEFQISRIYLTAEAKYGSQVKSKVVLEGNTTQTPTTWVGSNTVFLKNAFLEYTDLYPGGNLAIGLIGTSWIGYEEGIWGRRFVAKVMVDEDKTLPSADKGISIRGKIADGIVDYDLALVNGEGVAAGEKAGGDGNKKDGFGRVSIVPFAWIEQMGGVKLHGYVHQGRSAEGKARLRDRYIGGASFKNTRMHVMGSYYWKVDGDGKTEVKGKGYSVHGSVNLPLNFSVFGLMDRADPSSVALGDTYVRSIYGVDYLVYDGIRVALDSQTLNRRENSSGKKDRYESLFLLHLEAKF